LYSQIQLNLSIAMHAGMPLELPAQQKWKKTKRSTFLLQ
jgi:hypothetical protein